MAKFTAACVGAILAVMIVDVVDNLGYRKAMRRFNEVDK